MSNSDAYFKKEIVYSYRGRELRFRVSQSLFSSFDIDLGTRHLLQTLTSKGFDTYKKVLDLGCGYGPIGIALKSAYDRCIVHMVDRDAVAIEYAQQNVELNNLSGFKVYKSLGYDDVSEVDFDLIVSNIPAKVGEPVLSHIIEDAKYCLCPGGKVAVVVIDAIGEYVTKVLKSNKDINILFYKRWPGHLVFHYEFSKDSYRKIGPKINSFEEGVYDRSSRNIQIGMSMSPFKIVYGLAEFDILSYETELLINKINIFQGQQIDRAIIFNPGQGFVPVALSTTARVGKIDLVDRDLLSLKISRENMILNGYEQDQISLLHEVGIPNSNLPAADCIIGILDEKDEPQVHPMIIREATSRLSNNGTLIIASGSTAITRMEFLIKREKFLRIVERQKSKRKSLMVLKKRN
jgi:16S rRNA G1207 methylase RsmC